VFHDLARGIQSVRLHEHGDQPGSNLQERLAAVGAERRQRVEPLARGAMGVELPLFLFRGLAQAPPQRHVVARDRDEVPRLQVGAAGRRTGGADRVLDDRPRHLA
jgi:hypothetical protein